MPDYTVIAGPNGAGKSSFSKSLSRPDAIIFDPDKYKISIESQYPDLSEEAVESSVTIAYSELEIEVLKARKSLTVETNLRNQFLVERAVFFLKSGVSNQFNFYSSS